jgi:hypothetical protein
MRIRLGDIQHLVEAKMPMTTGRAGTFTLYRVEESQENAESFVSSFEHKKMNRTSIGIPGLFVTDNPFDWTGKYFIVLKAIVRNPLVLKNDDKSIEERIGPTDKWLDDVKSQGYDAIVSVPKMAVIGTRQMLLLYPNGQVLSARVVQGRS